MYLKDKRADKSDSRDAGHQKGYIGQHRGELRFRAPSSSPSFEISLSRAFLVRPFEIGQARLIDSEGPFEPPRRDSKRQLRIPGGCEETHKDREGIVAWIDYRKNVVGLSRVLTC